MDRHLAAISVPTSDQVRLQAAATALQMVGNITYSKEELNQKADALRALALDAIGEIIAGNKNWQK